MSTVLRDKVMALTDEQLAQLVMVADHALCDLQTSAMIAEEIGVDPIKLREFGDEVVMPLGNDAEVALGWYEKAGAEKASQQEGMRQ